MTFNNFENFIHALSDYQTLVVTDIRGIIIWVDDSFEATTGYRKNEVIDKNISLIRSPFTDPSHFIDMRQCLMNQIPWRGDFINRKKDGTFFRVEAVIFPLEENNQILSFGAVWKYRSTMICNAERSLRIKDEKGFSIIHKEGEIFTVNSNHPKIIFNSINDTFTLNTFVNSITEAESANDTNECRDALLHGKCFMKELNIAVDCQELGELLYFTIYCGHYSKCIVYYVKDVTELKKQEVLNMHQSRLASAGEMLATIAHQWKQPLNVISASIIDTKFEAMLGEAKQENCLKKMDLIDEQVKFLSKTINTFTDFLSTNAKNEPFFLLEAVEKAISMCIHRIKKNLVTLTVNIQPSHELVGVKDEMIHVIINLMNNAVDAFEETKVHSPTISITSYEKENFIIIEIQDNAGGINKSALHKIFDPYFSTKTTKHGTGIGLYIVQNTIKEHFKGTIQAENKNDGALFTFTIPNKNLSNDKKDAGILS